jgi:hypothetical protein
VAHEFDKDPSADSIGTANHTDLAIHVDIKQAKQRQLEILCHEIVHGIVKQMRPNCKVNEDLIDKLGIGWGAVLTDNFEVFNKYVDAARKERDGN